MLLNIEKSVEQDSQSEAVLHLSAAKYRKNLENETENILKNGW